MDGNVDLGAGLESFVDHLVREGRYASRDEVLRESVRMLEERERERKAQLAELEASILRGIADAEAGRVRDAEEVLAELDARYAAMEKARGAK